MGGGYRDPKKSVLAAARYRIHIERRHPPLTRRDHEPPPHSQHLHRTRCALRLRSSCGTGLRLARQHESVAVGSQAGGVCRSPAVRARTGRLGRSHLRSATRPDACGRTGGEPSIGVMPPGHRVHQRYRAAVNFERCGERPRSVIPGPGGRIPVPGGNFFTCRFYDTCKFAGWQGHARPA